MNSVYVNLKHIDLTMFHIMFQLFFLIQMYLTIAPADYLSLFCIVINVSFLLLKKLLQLEKG